MSFPQGIDFRASAFGVSDPLNHDKEIGTTANYPRVSAQSNNVGWEQAPTLTRDRSAVVDARLAGVAGVFDSTATIANYRIDLPATGNYDIRLAIGDQASAHTNQTVELFDGASSLGVVISAASTNAAEFYDATGVKRTSVADWVANNAAITKTFATTILRVKLGDNSSGDNTVIAHVFVQASAATTLPPHPMVVDTAVSRASNW